MKSLRPSAPAGWARCGRPVTRVYELNDKAEADNFYEAFTAPTTGIHGWFWENKGKKQVDIHLTTAGFYDSAKMYVDGSPDELTIQDAK